MPPARADHLQHPHDPVFINPTKSQEELGRIEGVSVDDLGPDEVRVFIYGQLRWGLLDCLGACKFVFIPHSAAVVEPNDLVDLVNASTGWDRSLWALMKDSERALNLARCFNMREGFTVSDETLPDRFFGKLAFGQWKGSKVDGRQFDEALRLHYEMMGWDGDTEVSSAAKLHKLDLAWADPRSARK